MNRADGGLDIVTVHYNINDGTTDMGSLEDSDAQAAAVQNTPNRVTLESMKARIDEIEYIHPTAIPHMTICVIVVDNGFALVGHTTPADPENYNEELGRQFSYENALRQMWPLEAYLLREQLTEDE